MTEAVGRRPSNKGCLGDELIFSTHRFLFDNYCASGVMWIKRDYITATERMKWISNKMRIITGKSTTLINKYYKNYIRPDTSTGS